MFQFIIRTNKHGKYVVRYAYRGETIFTSVPYRTKDEAAQAIASVQESGPFAPTEDKT